jgi:hypothetical protein
MADTGTKASTFTAKTALYGTVSAFPGVGALVLLSALSRRRSDRKEVCYV